MTPQFDYVLYDIEGDGLYDTVTQLWCAVMIDLPTGEIKGYRPDELCQFLEDLQRAKLRVGHNIIDYDLNPPGGKLSHEEGAEVREHQFTGSRALQRWSQVILGFERNKHASDEEKHFSRIRLIKDRMYGNTGMVYTQYDVPSGCLNEREGDEEEVPKEDDTPI